MSAPGPEKPVNIAIVRKPASLPEEEPNLAGRRPATPTPIASRPSTPGEGFTHWITRPVIAAPLVLLSLGLVGWNLFIRWPDQATRVQARPLPTRTPVVTPTMEEVAALRGQTAIALLQVVTNNDQVPRLIAALEQRARQAGFVTELTTRPSDVPIASIPEFTTHRVVLKLENNYDRESPAFHRLLGWLQQTSELGVKADVASLSVQSLGDGLTTATVELHIPAFQTDAPTAPK